MPIALDANTKSLQIVLAGAKNTNDAGYVCTYERIPVATNTVGLPSGAIVLTEQQGTTNGVTAVTIMPAPGAGYVHRLKTFQLQNADLAAITASFQVVDSTGPTTTVCFKVVKQTLENLSYEDGLGWQNFDVNGATIAQAPTTSANVSTAQLLATSAWSVLTQINAPASVLSTSVQASSLAAAVLPASVNSVSSQASSMAALNPNTVSSLQSAASVQSFTSTNWATISSATSRVKSSFTW